MDEDALVELKAQYMEQQQALHSRQTRLQQEVEDKDTAAAQLECQIQERRQQQEHFQVPAGFLASWAALPCVSTSACQLLRTRGMLGSPLLHCRVVSPHAHICTSAACAGSSRL
jgi:hypothetical protein